MKRLLLLPFLVATSLAQGPLTPPGTAGPLVGPVAPLDGSGNPQPTMKTLHQVEPRVPVQTLAATAPYTISQPGSYYLTDNIIVSSGDAIVIASNDVALDLNGYTIKSTASVGVSGTAISITGSHSRLSVRNGSIVSSTTVPASGSPVSAGFYHGIYAGGAITQVVVSDIHITGVGANGMWLDNQGIVERCTVADCGNHGILADEIHDCNVKNCYGTAINASGNVSNCVGTSTSSQGISVGGNATNCVGTSNGTSTSGVTAVGSAINCSGTAISGIGLFANRNALNCTGTSSSGTGLSVGENAMNCSGISSSGIGLYAGENATNCSGHSSGTGLFAGGNATNCTGVTTGNGGIGLWAQRTASYCFGQYPGGGSSSTGLKASIAIGCTYTAGLTGLDVPAGKSFNM